MDALDEHTPLTVRAAQAEVDASIRALGGYWPPLANLARLFEECGELARAVNQAHGPKQIKPGEGHAAAREELGDALYVLLVLANSLEIDAGAALDGVLAKVRARAPKPADDNLDPVLNDRSAYQRCFACGARNPIGLQLVFREEDAAIVTDFTPGPEFAGFPGVVHGGIVATLLDEALNRTAVREQRWLMTGRLDIRYRQAAPVGRTLRVTARTVSSRKRMVQASGDIRLAAEPETIVATAEGIFLPIPEEYQREMVAEHPELAGFFGFNPE
jgi:NTP pyrophosphatase (non-canonical NTP hydrolase)/acyl-coenzyme A thioesterase PaaI-like protein